MARASRRAAFLPAYPRWPRPKGMADRAPDHSRAPFGRRAPKRSTPRKFWINRLPPVGLVVPVVDHDQCHPLIDLRLAIEADVLLVGVLLLSGCGSRKEVIQTACKAIPSRSRSLPSSRQRGPSKFCTPKSPLAPRREYQLDAGVELNAEAVFADSMDDNVAVRLTDAAGGCARRKQRV